MNPKLFVLKFVHKWHIWFFILALDFVVFGSYNLVIVLAEQSWITMQVAIVLDVILFVVFNWTHYQAIRLTKEAIYLFGIRVEQNFFMRFLIKKYGFNRASRITTIIANETLLLFGLSYLLRVPVTGPRISVVYSLVIALISSLDYLNDLIATKTINALMNRDDDFSIYAKLLPHPLQ